jgi:GNAT superfamily N-acetyltransferase
MSPTIDIRALNAGDSIAELTQMLHLAYQSLGDTGLNYTAVDQNEAVTRSRIAGGSCLVAIHDGRLVGSIVFRDKAQKGGSPWMDRSDVATFGQFGILPHYQSRGLGSRLLEAVERMAVDDKAEELALDTADQAEHLIQYYEKRGYRRIEYAQWSGKRYRSVILSKALA